MLVTEFGMATDVREVQPQKALSAMLVTEFGMATDVREVQSLKAFSAMPVTVFGIRTSFFASGHSINSVTSLLYNTPVSEL